MSQLTVDLASRLMDFVAENDRLSNYLSHKEDYSDKKIMDIQQQLNDNQQKMYKLIVTLADKTGMKINSLIKGYVDDELKSMGIL